MFYLVRTFLFILLHFLWFAASRAACSAPLCASLNKIMDLSSTVLQELDNLLPPSSYSSAKVADEIRSAGTHFDEGDEKELMFGDLTEAFENLDRRDFMSPSRKKKPASSGTRSKTRHHTPLSEATRNPLQFVNELASSDAQEILVSPTHAAHLNSIHSIRQHVEASQSRYSSLRKQNRENEKAIKVLEESNKSSIAESRRKGDINESLKAKLEAETNTTAHLQKRVRELESLVESLKTDQRRTSKELQRARNKVDLMEKRNSEFKHVMQEQSFVTEGESRRVKAAMDGMNLLISELKVKNRDMEGELKDMTTLKDQVVASSLQLAESKRSNEALERELEECTKERNKLRGEREGWVQLKDKAKKERKSFDDVKEELKVLRLQNSDCLEAKVSSKQR